MWFGDRIFWLRERFMRPENRTDVSCLADMNQPGLNDESYSLDFQRERVAWIVDHSGDGKVLDIGCGFGYILAERGMSGVGVDYDMARLSDALYRAEHPDEFPKWRGLQFYALDIRFGLPWDDGSFETVWLAEVLEHCHWSDAQYLLAEAVRCAGEQVLITIPYMPPVGEPYHLGNLESDDHKWYATDEMLARLLNGRQYDIEFICGLLFACIVIKK